MSKIKKVHTAYGPPHSRFWDMFYGGIAPLFSDKRFPDSLPGILRTQFDIAEGLLTLAFKFAKDFGLSTDALADLPPHGTRKSKIEKLVNRDRPISLVQKTRWRTAVV